MTNLAHEFVRSQGKSIAEAREAYDGACIDFAGDLIEQFLFCGRLAWFDTEDHPKWRYHAAAEVNGIIHDLWANESMPLADYMKHVGATSVEYPADEPDEDP